MKKNLMTVLILALLVVNIVLNCVIMISVTSTNKTTSSLVNNIATALNLELTPPGEEEKVQVSLADTETHQLGAGLMFPMAAGEDGKQSYFVCDITLSINKKHADYKQFGGENIVNYDGLIQDAITTVISSRTLEECRDDFEGLKADILKAVQDNVFNSDFIYQISISGVKYG